MGGLNDYFASIRGHRPLLFARQEMFVGRISRRGDNIIRTAAAIAAIGHRPCCVVRYESLELER